ncbi:MAG: hypothetical protein HWE30_11325 [Methylocystaceae bacterium]|nr:hypothetical protein [Methylocystaceae bacterium]
MNERTTTTESRKHPICVIRGVSDVGSAIAWKLFHAGFIVVSHENRQPRTIRRKMAFCDALWTGEAVLDGLKAHRVDRLEDVMKVASPRQSIALYAGPFDALLDQVKPDVIVDGRIHKFSTVETLKDRAPLTIAVGPCFEAGVHVDYVVESCWGDDLGRVISQGSAVEPVPVPPRLNGVGWERFVRSDRAGRFESDLSIGEYVVADQIIGHLDGHAVKASIAGYLRGLLHPGLSVLKGEKLCEIDPRENQAHFIGLAERPSEIADGVLRVACQFMQVYTVKKGVKDHLYQYDPELLTNNIKIS